MTFKRATVPCRWPGCPNKTRRVMDNQEPVKTKLGMVGTSIVLCEFHLGSLMAEIKGRVL